MKIFTIGDLAKRTVLAVSAIRFYEEKGLLIPERTNAGHRRYIASDIRRLSFIMIAQRLGFSLITIREQLKRLPKNRTPTKTDWSKISRSFARDIDARIAALEMMKEKLDGCIGCGCLSLRACTLYNPDDVAADLGTGPRYLMGDRSLNMDC